MNVKAIVFDLDGTLINSAKVWIDIDIEYEKKYGLKIPEDYFEIIKPMGFSQLAVYYADVLGVPRTPEEIMAEWHSMAEEKYKNEVLLKPYAKDFIEKQHKLGVKMCIATANNTSLTEAALKRLGILGCFEFILSCDEISCGKDTPQVYLEASKRLGFSPSETAVFEDMLHGILSAKAGGFYTVAVLDGMYGSDDEEQIKKCADKYINGYDELL